MLKNIFLRTLLLSALALGAFTCEPFDNNTPIFPYTTLYLSDSKGADLLTKPEWRNANFYQMLPDGGLAPIEYKYYAAYSQDDPSFFIVRSQGEGIGIDKKVVEYDRYILIDWNEQNADTLLLQEKYSGKTIGYIEKAFLNGELVWDSRIGYDPVYYPNPRITIIKN
jgi:hypothetical protein